MSYITGFYKGRLGIGLTPTMGMGDGNPRFPLDINGDIRLTGDIMNENGMSLLGSSANGTFVLTDISNVVLGNDSYNVGIGTTIPSEKLDISGNIKTNGYFHYTSPIGGLVGDYPRGSGVGDIYPIFCLQKNYIPTTSGNTIPKYSVGYCYPPNCDVPGTTDHSWGLYIDGTTSSPSWEPYANWFLSGTKDKWSYMQSGRLGIGTTSPVSALTIGGTTNTLSDTIITLASDGGSQYKQGIKMIHHGGAPNGGTDGTQYGWYMFGSDVTDKLHIGSYNGSSTETDHLVITRGDGNVGIGTTVPSQLLHLFNNDTSWAVYANIRLSTDNNNGNSYYGEIGYFRGNSPGNDEGLVFSGRQASRKDMVILSSNGNVGIATTNPSYKLDVNGDFCVSPYYSIKSGAIDATGKNSSHWHKYNFSQGPGSVGQGIHVFLYRSVHDNGGWHGSLAFECIFYPSHYGHLWASYWYVIRNMSRGDYGTIIGKVYSHGQWGHGSIWVRGGRRYRYVVINGSDPSDGNEHITSAESVGDGSAGWSDDRIKHNEIHIDNALSVIEQLKPQKYIKTENKIYHERHDFVLDSSGNPLDSSGNSLDINDYKIETGLIAQDVEKIEELKYLVSNANVSDHNGDQIKAIDYRDVFVYNIAATKELYKKQKANKEEIDSKINEIDNKTQELDNKINNKTQELDNKIIEIKNTEDLLLNSNKYEKNNTENIIGNISFVNGYTTINNKKIYNKNISDKLYFNPETSKLYCSNIESTYYGDGSNLQGIAKLSQIEHLIEDNKRLIQDNENNKELINFWTKQAMNLNNKLTTVETKLANVENELKLIKENLGL